MSVEIRSIEVPVAEGSSDTITVGKIYVDDVLLTREIAATLDQDTRLAIKQATIDIMVADGVLEDFVLLHEQFTQCILEVNKQLGPMDDIQRTIIARYSKYGVSAELADVIKELDNEHGGNELLPKRKYAVISQLGWMYLNANAGLSQMVAGLKNSMCTKAQFALDAFARVVRK